MMKYFVTTTHGQLAEVQADQCLIIDGCLVFENVEYIAGKFKPVIVKVYAAQHWTGLERTQDEAK